MNDQQRIEMSADNCEVLRARLAKYEDADGNPKAQPSGVVQWPEADEIMQMAFEEGQPSEDASGYYFELEEFDLFIQRLMEEVARLNSSPVSDGDERSHDTKGSRKALGAMNAKLRAKVGRLERELAALSAPSHGEQVREVEWHVDDSDKEVWK